MDASQYAQLGKFRERWVSDDPRVDVNNLLDTALKLFSLYEENPDFSEEAWSALYLTAAVIELLETAALRGGSLDLPDTLLYWESDTPIPELDGQSTRSIIAELIDGEGRMREDCVTAFRYLHEEFTSGYVVTDGS